MGYYVNEINATGKIAVDDTILVKGTPATAGSKMLGNFVPPYNATVVEKLIAERQAARKEKNFARADEIRDILLEKGIVFSI